MEHTNRNFLQHSLSRAIKIFGILYENSKKSGRLQRAVVRSVPRYHLNIVVVRVPGGQTGLQRAVRKM